MIQALTNFKKKLNTKNITDKVLSAREKRAKIRGQFAQKGVATISLTFNIPGFPKHNQLTDSCFDNVLDELKTFLLANRIFIKNKENFDEIDDAGRFFITELDTKINLDVIKEFTENFETNHALGRILDVDIFDANAQPVSSGQSKPCVICKDKSAIRCMRENTHTYDELRKFIFDKIWIYNTEQRNIKIKKKLSEMATRAIVQEVSLSPKPGLVDFYTSGAHSDMDYYTFIASSAAISQFWAEFADYGLNYNGNLTDALPTLRQIGIRAENQMFEATKGVNTQKGLIFMLGLSIFTSAYVLKDNKNFEEKLFVKTMREMCKDLVKKDLVRSEKLTSNGEKTFKKYGLKGAGARHQAEAGLPIIFDEILPFFIKKLNFDNPKPEIDKVLQTALLKIIYKLDDSNVLYRKNIVVAEEVKKKAKLVLKEAGSYDKFCDFCLKNNVSPGGAADMLAVGLFLYFVKLNF